MALFCSNCGTQVPGSFCPNCGTPVAAGPVNPDIPHPSAGYAPPAQVVGTGGLEPHVASALCYAPFTIGLICSVLFLVIAPYNQNKFVRFSAFQSLFLHLALFVLFIALSMIHLFLVALIHVLSLLFIPLYPLLWLAIIVLFLFLMYKSFNNQQVNLPFIGNLAQKQA
jgi:uncharacterized membrane protein